MAKKVTAEGIERSRSQLHKDAELLMSETPLFRPYLYEASRSEGTHLKTLLRSNTMQLMGVVGKWSGQQWSDQMQRCWLCATEEEDVAHFVASCP